MNRPDFIRQVITTTLTKYDILGGLYWGKRVQMPTVLDLLKSLTCSLGGNNTYLILVKISWDKRPYYQGQISCV